MRGEQEEREPPAGRGRGPAPAASELTPAGGDAAYASGGRPSPLGAPKQRRARRARSAASVTVSTIARPVSPLSFEATICVVITRKLPPKTYGALKEASDVMKVRSAAPRQGGRRAAAA